MTSPDESNVFQEFKQHYANDRGGGPADAEEAFMKRLLPRVARLARQQLTNDVRRLFDTNDITSTVMRKVVGAVRGGAIRLETEGQFMSLLATMTKQAIVDKHDYLTRLMRQQSQCVSLHGFGGQADDSGAADWDLAASDDVRRQGMADGAVNPVDEMILAEKTQALNALCATIRRLIGNAEDWALFRMRFLEERRWGEIARELDILDDEGAPSADGARMRLARKLDMLRPKLREYEDWLGKRP